MNLLDKLYRTVYLIRAAEDGIRRYYSEDDMKTPMHMSSGSEAVVAGVCEALRPDDQVYGTYRTHALYLAKTYDAVGFFGELYGKVTGPGRGKAGSMHLADPNKGYMVSSAIVASTIPVAVGNAFANKYFGRDRVTVAFFGDGATNEGNFWESLNLACLWELPIIFVCEDNNFAVHTHKKDRDGFNEILDVVKSFRCKVFESSSTDCEDIYNLTSECLPFARSNTPVFMKLSYYRYLEHVGVNFDFEAKYRSESEFQQWLQKDPVTVLKNRMNAESVERINQEVDELVESAVLSAKQAEFAPTDEVLKDVFYGE